jgi:hypothetical protein
MEVPYIKNNFVKLLINCFYLRCSSLKLVEKCIRSYKALNYIHVTFIYQALLETKLVFLGISLCISKYLT